MDYLPPINFHPAGHSTNGHHSEPSNVSDQRGPVQDDTMTDQDEGAIQFESAERFDDFANMGLKPELLRGIYALGLEYPSYIQERAIVPITRGSDMIIQAKSGTGKTVAMIIGVLQRIRPEINKCQAIIIEPTHEMAEQTTKHVSILGQFMNIQCFTFIGGRSIFGYLDSVYNGQINIAVGTFGRLFHVLKAGVLDSRHVKVLVMDEFDDLLGKQKDRENMDKMLREIVVDQLQFVLLSATRNEHILQIADNYMVGPHPVRILLKRKELGLGWIKEYFVRADDNKAKLQKILDYFCTTDIGQTLIFCNRKLTVDWLIERLESRNYKVRHIHSDMMQSRREHVFQEFIAGRTQILITSDLLSRGIDVQQVSHIINFDFPERFNTYVHRIGRSGRYGREGTAITFFESSQMQYKSQIENLHSTHLEELVIEEFRTPPTEWINLFLAAIICLTKDSVVVDWVDMANLMARESNMSLTPRMDPKRCETLFNRLVGKYVDVLSESKSLAEAKNFIYLDTFNRIDLQLAGVSLRVVETIAVLWDRLLTNEFIRQQEDYDL